MTKALGELNADQAAAERLDQLQVETGPSDPVLGAEESTGFTPEAEMVDTSGVFGQSPQVSGLSGEQAIQQVDADYAKRRLSEKEVLERAARDRADLEKRYQSTGGENIYASPRMDKAARFASINKRHDRFASMMAVQALTPLRDGVNGKSVMAVCSTAALMWCLSPQLRHSVGPQHPTVKQLLLGQKDSVVRKIVSKDFWSSVTKREGAQRKADSLEESFMARMNKVESTADRIPMSTESAAMTALQVRDQAYEAMRLLGAKPAEISGLLAEDMKSLEEQWEEDGLDVGDVRSATRDLVAERASQDPTYAARFKETASGMVRMSTQTKGRLGRGTQWDRGWETAEGRRLGEESSMFTVRQPQDAMNHATDLAVTMAVEMRSAAEKGGPDALRDVMVAYESANRMDSAAWASLQEGGSGSHRDRRIAIGQRVQATVQAMRDDGIPEALRTEGVGWAADQARRILDRDHPELMSQFETRHGQTYEGDREAFLSQVAAKSDRRLGREALEQSPGAQISDEESRRRQEQVEDDMLADLPPRQERQERPNGLFIRSDEKMAQLTDEAEETRRMPGVGQQPKLPGQLDSEALAGSAGEAAPVEASGPQQENSRVQQPPSPMAEKGSVTWRKEVQDQAAENTVAPPVLPDAAVQTPAQKQQAEAFNTSYVEKESLAEVSYDDPGTPEVTETKGTGSGKGAAIKANRIRVAREAIDMEANARVQRRLAQAEGNKKSALARELGPDF